MKSLAAWVGTVLLAGAAYSAAGPADLFEKPVALTDASGTPMITGKAQGCPFAADFNGDGKVDIILGAKEGMDTARRGIWLIPNQGTNERPAFSWIAARRVKLAGGTVGVKCGCKSGGHVLVQGLDWNADGYLDIVYSDTYQRTYLLLNDGKSRQAPTFTQRVFFKMEKRNHGMHAGGGDWNADGVMDFLHMPFAGGSYKLFKGSPVTGGGLKFQEGGLKQCTVIQRGGERGDRARKCAWAWDFTGTSRARGVTEYVGIAANNRDIAFFEMSSGKSRKVATLVTPEGKTPLLTIGDLNADGRMDIVFSCGLWNNERDKTKVYVMYGKPASDGAIQ